MRRWQVWRASSNHAWPRSTLPSKGLSNALSTLVHRLQNSNENYIYKLNQKRVLTCCWLRRMLRLKATKAVVNKLWMSNAAVVDLRPLLQRQRAPLPPLSKLSWASFESITTDGRSEFNCSEKKRGASYKLRNERRRREQTETPKKTSPSNASSQKLCVEDALV